MGREDAAGRVKSSKHIVIIGGGIIGLCTAYYSARRGHDVTVIERGADETAGCSMGNAGMICPSHFIPLAAPGMVALGLKWMWNPESPFYIKPRLDPELLDWGFKFWRAATPQHVARCAPVLRDLHFASRELFIELARSHEFGLEQRGLLMLCNTQHALEEEARTANHARQLGVPADVLDAKQTAALEPDVRMDIAGAVYFPKDCHLTPGRFVAALKKELENLGVRFEWNTAVTGLARHGTRIERVQTSRGEVSGDEMVLCGGSWSPVIARDLKLKIPVQAGKGYSLTLSQPRQLPKICAILTEARVAMTPMDGALRFGGTMEIAGLNEEINPRRVQGIIKSVQQYYPDFAAEDFAGIQPWRGLRPCSPDGMPYLGRTRRYENLSIATGHGMMGLSLGPITGKLMAEILSDEMPSHDLSLLSPDRFV